MAASVLLDQENQLSPSWETLAGGPECARTRECIQKSRDHIVHITARQRGLLGVCFENRGISVRAIGGTDYHINDQCCTGGDRDF